MAVIIVGGGMTGCSLALAIASMTKGQLPVHLIEASLPEQGEHTGFDARTIALSAGSCQYLTELGIWPYLSAKATAIKQIEVSDQGHLGHTTIKAKEYALQALGYVVELQTVGKALFALLKQQPAIHLHCPQQVLAIERTQQNVRVRLNNQQVLEGALLVMATGTQSALAVQCGFRWQHQDYQQTAIIANVRCSRGNQGRAFEHFTSQGPLALLPITEGNAALVWCRRQMDDLLHCDDEIFLTSLQRQFGEQLGQFVQVSQRHYYPLVLSQAESVVNHRMVLVGNAAQTLHPIAGQGFNLGLRDVMILAKLIRDAHLQGNDPGDYALLAHYQQQRYTDKQNTIYLTDSLVRLFANDAFPLVIARNIGLFLCQQSRWLRDKIAIPTLGWGKH